MNLEWRQVVAERPPTNPTNPADPSYDFSHLDAVVRSAESRGLNVVFTVYSAPDWAEDRRPAGSDAPAGSWKPNPRDLGDFAQALSTRYSGQYAGLPRVGFYEVWNEPNLTRYLAPQWSGRKLVAAERYRRMLNAFYAGIRAGRGGGKVIAGATAPYGDDPGGARSRPLRFLRGLFCLADRQKLRLAGCPKRAARAHFDILSHHPINTSGGPHTSAIHPDDASTPDLKFVKKTLRGAERRHSALGQRRHPLWATEFWWQSNPPDRFHGVPLKIQAERYAETLYLLWKQGASVALMLQLRDAPYSPNNSDVSFQAGLYFVGGEPKPSLSYVRFPFVADAAKNDRVVLWAKAPAAGRLVIERKRKQGWARVKSAQVHRGGIFATRVRLHGRQRLRARVAGRTSAAAQVK